MNKKKKNQNKTMNKKKNRKNNLLGKAPDEIEFSDQIKFVLITLNKTL